MAKKSTSRTTEKRPVLLTVAELSDAQGSYVQLEAVDVYYLVLAAIARAQNEATSQTIFVHEQGEPFGVTITVQPGSDPIATYSDYLEALLCDSQSSVGPSKRDRNRDIWYQTLEQHLALAN
jgi:hypothetical protein